MTTLILDGWPCIRCRENEAPDAESLCLECADAFTPHKITGTPKTLADAIDNGLNAGNPVAHVLDFLSQHFGTYMIRHPESHEMLSDLWGRIKRSRV